MALLIACGAVSRLALLLAGLAYLAGLTACATRPDSSQASPPKEWRLVPQTTVTADRRQFFVYGERLDSAKVTSAPGVKVEQGWVKEDGKVLSLYLTVAPLAGHDDSTLTGEKPGSRKILVKTADTSVTLPLRVLDEAPGR